MTVVLDLKPETLRRIEEQAAQKGMTPEQILTEMAESNFDDQEKGDALAAYLLDKNQELYRRLA